MAEYEELEIQPIKVAKPDEYQWATKIAGRRPEFKVHRTAGQAHSAISYRSRGRGYQLVFNETCSLYKANAEEGVWEAVHHFPAGSVWRMLPWQEDPGSPQERQRADEVRRFLSGMDSAVWQIEHRTPATFTAAESAALVKELKRAKLALADILRYASGNDSTTKGQDNGNDDLVQPR